MYIEIAKILSHMCEDLIDEILVNLGIGPILSHVFQKCSLPFTRSDA